MPQSPPRLRTAGGHALAGGSGRPSAPLTMRSFSAMSSSSSFLRCSKCTSMSVCSSSRSFSMRLRWMSCGPERSAPRCQSPAAGAAGPPADGGEAACAPRGFQRTGCAGRLPTRPGRAAPPGRRLLTSKSTRSPSGIFGGIKGGTTGRLRGQKGTVSRPTSQTAFHA